MQNYNKTVTEFVIPIKYFDFNKIHYCLTRNHRILKARLQAAHTRPKRRQCNNVRQILVMKMWKVLLKYRIRGFFRLLNRAAYMNASEQLRTEKSTPSATSLHLFSLSPPSAQQQPILLLALTPYIPGGIQTLLYSYLITLIVTT